MHCQYHNSRPVPACAMRGRVVLCDGACASSLLSVTVVRPSLVDQLTTRTSMWCPWQVVDVCCISGLVLFALPHEGWSPNSLARMRFLFQVSTWTERASSLCGRAALFFFVSFDIAVVVANVAAREADAEVKIRWPHDRKSSSAASGAAITRRV